MFLIGEFSKIARVSTRMLRHYDKIGLLSPEHVDAYTGYRYYSANQLPQLNRVIALKDLGFTLDQIGRLLHEEIGADEIRGMLMMRKGEIERLLTDEVSKLRSVESRLTQIENDGGLPDAEVVLKGVPDQRFLSVREVCPSLGDGLRLFQEISAVLPAHVDNNIMGHFAAISHTDGFTNEDIDIEIGVFLTGAYDSQIALPGGERMAVRVVPGVETMATIAMVGLPDERHPGYGAIGMWIEGNGYRIAGNEREVFIEPPVQGREHEAVTEIQIRLKRRPLKFGSYHERAWITFKKRSVQLRRDED